MHKEEGCLFCDENFSQHMIADFGSVYAVYDSYAVTKGHVLIIPYGHSADYFHMSPEEKIDVNVMLNKLHVKLIKEDKTIVGFNIGINCGEVAGQTIMHSHIHLIPRRDGDVEDPIGGIRNVIPGKGNYKKW